MVKYFEKLQFTIIKKSMHNISDQRIPPCCPNDFSLHFYMMPEETKKADLAYQTAHPKIKN